MGTRDAAPRLPTLRPRFRVPVQPSADADGGVPDGAGLDRRTEGTNLRGVIRGRQGQPRMAASEHYPSWGWELTRYVEEMIPATEPADLRLMLPETVPLRNTGEGGSHPLACRDPSSAASISPGPRLGRSPTPASSATCARWRIQRDTTVSGCRGLRKPARKPRYPPRRIEVTHTSRRRADAARDGTTTDDWGGPSSRPPAPKK